MDNLVFEESMTSESPDSEFISKKWVFCNDNNVGNYSSQVVLDSTVLANSGSYIGWSEGYILMPLVVQLTSTTPADLKNDQNDGDQGSRQYRQADQSWAFKNGFWQMIHSMQVEFNNNGCVQQFPFLNVFASFKAQTSFSDADVFNHGDGIGFYMDTAESWTYQNSTNPTTFANYCALSAADGVGLCNNKNLPPANFTLNSIQNTSQDSAGLTTGSTRTYVTTQQPVYSVGVDNNGGQTYQSNNSFSTSGKSYPDATTEYNVGMRMRQKATLRGVNYTRTVVNSITPSLISSTSSNFGYTGQELLMPVTSLQQVWASYQVPISADGCKAWNIYAKLRLKDLADFFHKIPLLKGATMRFIFNTNQTITNFTFTNPTTPAPINTPTVGTAMFAVATNPFPDPIPTPLATLPIYGTTGLPTANASLYATGVNVVGGMTNPLMIASGAWGQGSSSLRDGDYQLSVSIVKCNFTQQAAFANQANTALQSCRLYVPLYKMTPAAEKMYLAPKTKTVCYKDVVSYQFTTIPSQNNFNILVSQAIKNVKSVLVVPLVASGANGTSCYSAAQPATLVRPSTLLSPFSTTGATPDPIIINNFNVQIQGVNVFLQDEMYDFEAFKHQLMSSNQLNGNLTTGLTSGLINEKMFSYLYRYYYADCSRTLPAEKDVDRSVQIKGRNLSTSAIDLLVFIEFEKYLTVDLETGARVD